MSIRLTPVLAVAMAMSLAACQEEESPAPEETTGQETGDASGTETGAVGNDSAATSDSATGGDTAETGESAMGDDSQMSSDDMSGDSAEQSSAAEVEESTTDTGAASQEASDAAQVAAQDGDSPAAAAEDEASQAAGAEGTVGAEAGDGTALEDVLTPEGFDQDRVMAAIDEADLDDSRKDELRELAETAAEAPMEADAELSELRDALLTQDGADASGAMGAAERFAAAPGSLFAPDRFGGSSDLVVAGADLGATMGAIFPAEPVSVAMDGASAWVDADTGALARTQTIHR